jgi:hypothetical protein
MRKTTPLVVVVLCTREISKKGLGSASPGFKEASCLGNPAGGFGLSWLKAVLGMKTMPRPNYFFFVPYAGERPRKRPCTAQHKEEQTKLGLGSRGGDAMDVAQTAEDVVVVVRQRRITAEEDKY